MHVHPEKEETMNIQVNIAKAYTFYYTLIRDNVQVIPSSCTVSIYRTAGTSYLTAQTAAITSGVMSFSLTLAQIAELALSVNNRIRWTIIDGTTTTTIDQLFDVTGYTMDDLKISDNDLLNFAKYLKDTTYNVSGGVSSYDAGVPSLTDTKRDEETQFFKGGELEIFSGPGEGESRKVISFTAGVFGLERVFDTAPDSTSKYSVKQSFQDNIRTAFSEVEEKLFSVGIKSSQLIDIAQLRILIMMKATLNICFGMIKNPPDSWSYRYEKLEAEYDKKFDSLKLVYDADKSGNLDPEEQDMQLPGRVQFMR
jgi:hypothetical protein